MRLRGQRTACEGQVAITILTKRNSVVIPRAQNLKNVRAALENAAKVRGFQAEYTQPLSQWLPENENVGRWHVEDLNSLSNIRKLEPVRGGGSALVR